MNMIVLYETATDNLLDTETRWAAVKLMQQKRKDMPINYLRLHEAYVRRFKQYKMRKEQTT